MRSDAIEAFGELAEHYPGSRQKRRAVATTEPDAGEEMRWDAHPVFIEVDGVPHEFFLIGALGVVLNRKPVTLRKWIEAGILPKERYRTNVSTANGSRRLWTRAQIEGIARIAREEGLLQGANIGATKFAERVRELFRELKKVEP